MTLSTINITNRDHQIAKLSAIAVALSLIEFFFPSPIPGVKPGIANIIILYTIFKFDLNMGIWVSLIRVFVTSIILGSFLSPTFFLSLSGSLFSLIFLIAFRNLDRQNFSLISFSLIAALAHIFGQFIIVRIWIIPHNGVFYLLPIFLVSAFIFGLVNALVTNKLLKLNSKK
jgi:heptaprenyl diphosphate synthase|tara:strand:- start:2467 stop:2982 length:516 start_codon:yes stop_codon:yes gene_type:complete